MGFSGVLRMGRQGKTGVKGRRGRRGPKWASGFVGGRGETGSPGPQGIKSLAGATETCFSKGEKTDGMNKICFYSCVSGEAAITIDAIKLCPLSITR